jgi:hypothetical protein
MRAPRIAFVSWLFVSMASGACGDNRTAGPYSIAEIVAAGEARWELHP